MNGTWMAALAALTLVACSQEKEASKTTDPAPKTEAPAPKTTPKTAPTPKPAATIDADCAALLTDADVQKACKSKITWQKSGTETGQGSTFCSRKAGSGGARMLYTVGVYPDEAAAGQASKDVAPGAFKREEGGGGGMKATKVFARKGMVTLTLGTQTMGSAKALCAPDQLEALARTVYERLP